MTQPWGPRHDDDPRARPGQPRWALILLVGLLAVFIGALVWWLPDALDAQDQKIAFTSRLVILAVVAGGAIVHFRGRLHHAALQALAWAGIFLLVMIGYSFRAELGDLRDRVLGELVPRRAIAGADGSVAIRASSDGHFRVEVEVDGTKLRFLVDTGASGVVLSRRDAERLAIDRRQLHFTIPVQTANGTTMVAPVRFNQMVLGPIEVRDIGAAVNDNLEGASLLGMSFLNRLRGYAVRDGVLTLRP